MAKTTPITITMTTLSTIASLPFSIYESSSVTLIDDISGCTTDDID